MVVQEAARRKVLQHTEDLTWCQRLHALERLMRPLVFTHIDGGFRGVVRNDGTAIDGPLYGEQGPGGPLWAAVCGEHIMTAGRHYAEFPELDRETFIGIVGVDFKQQLC